MKLFVTMSVLPANVLVHSLEECVFEELTADHSAYRAKAGAVEGSPWWRHDNLILSFAIALASFVCDSVIGGVHNARVEVLSL